MRYGEFDVYIDGIPSGKLEIVKSGLLTCFECTADADPGEVLRLAADTGDKYETIGVMMPDGCGVHLKKYFTKNDLYIKNLGDAQKYVLIRNGEVYPSDNPDCADAPSDFPDCAAAQCDGENAQSAPEPENNGGSSVLWTPCPAPEHLFNDQQAGEAIAGCPDVLTSEKDGFTYVAVPVDPEKPFPAIPIFFFGSQGTYNGRDYLVFRLRDGQIQV